MTSLGAEVEFEELLAGQKKLWLRIRNTHGWPQW